LKIRSPDDCLSGGPHHWATPTGSCVPERVVVAEFETVELESGPHRHSDSCKGEVGSRSEDTVAVDLLKSPRCGYVMALEKLGRLEIEYHRPIREQGKDRRCRLSRCSQLSCGNMSQ